MYTIIQIDAIQANTGTIIRDFSHIPAGLFSPSDVQNMILEVMKMQEFHHPHVMSLIGVCLDAGVDVSIVLPYMGNGSLLDYLKKERDSLELDDDSEVDQVGLM